MTLEDIAVMSTKIPQELLISYMQDTSLIYLIAIFSSFSLLISLIIFLGWQVYDGVTALNEGQAISAMIFLIGISLFTIGAFFQAFESFIFYFNCYFNPLIMILKAAQ